MTRPRLPAALPLILAAVMTALGCTTGSPEPPERTAASPPSAVPLLRTEPVATAAAPSPDLDTLLAWLGDVPLVGLGENPHGVHEYHRLAHRIVVHSQTAGEPFDVVALEVDQAHAARLDDFVQGRRHDLDAVLAERWYGSKVFYDEALVDLLRWMRAHDRSAGRPVHVAGYDLKQPDLALRAVERTLGRVDPASATEARALRDPILALGGYGLFPNVSGYTASLRLPLPPAGASSGQRQLSAVVWVRGEGGGHGHVGMLASAVGGASGPARHSVEHPLPEIDGGWLPLGIHLAIPPERQELEVWLYHRGNGRVWFDDLRVALDGDRLGPPDPLSRLQPRPLMMPKLQVMDYTASRDPGVTRPDGTDSAPSLRVTCHPRVDAALQAAGRLRVLVDGALQAADDRLSPTEELWTRQMARLVEQAVHWRTLVESNRDVFLAENLAWLQRRAFPHGRVLAFGHQSHTERIPRRMGGFLAERYGDRYRTVTLHAEAGTYAYFGAVSTLDHDAPLELHAVEEVRGRRQLVPFLATLGDGDLMVNLRRLTASDPTGFPEGSSAHSVPDAAVLLRRVTPARVPGEITDDFAGEPDAAPKR